LFQAIEHAEYAALRTLAKTLIRKRNDPAALLCLDNIFSFPLELRNLPLSEIRESLLLYLIYVYLLKKFQRDESFTSGSNHQILFGFQPLGANRWLVPKHTHLHKKIVNRSGSTGHILGGYYGCSFEELRLGIKEILEGRIRDRTRVQNKTCYDVLGFSPCLRMLVQGKCDPPSGQGGCAFQHIKLEQLSVDWYHTRLRLILLQFQILGSALLYDFDTAKCVTALVPQDMSVGTDQM
jgi:hypothetical protein